MADEEARSEAIVERFRAMKTEAEALWAKITELDLERTEHELVLQTLKPLDAQRRCFRHVGGVLVERTVAEVAPAVTRNKEEIEAAIGRLGATLDEKNKELQAFQDKFKIRVRRNDEAPVADTGSGNGAQGVLVQQAAALESVPE